MMHFSSNHRARSLFSVERKNKGTVSKSFRLQSKRKRQKERRRERESEILHVCRARFSSTLRKWRNRSDFGRKGKEETLHDRWIIRRNSPLRFGREGKWRNGPRIVQISVKKEKERGEERKERIKNCTFVEQDLCFSRKEKEERRGERKNQRCMIVESFVERDLRFTRKGKENRRGKKELGTLDDRRIFRKARSTLQSKRKMKEWSPNRSDFSQKREEERKEKKRENQKRRIVRRTRFTLQPKGKIKERSSNRSDFSWKGKEERRERIRNVGRSSNLL